MRKIYKDAFLKKHNIKLGFMSAFVKAAAHALTDQPAVNAGKTTLNFPMQAYPSFILFLGLFKVLKLVFSTVIDDTTKEIVYRDYVDISVAVATPKVRLLGHLNKHFLYSCRIASLIFCK